MGGHSVGGTVQRVAAPLLEDPGYCLAGLIHLLVRIRSLGPGNRDQPVYIRMRKPGYQEAGAACPTWLVARLLTEHQLRQPEPQPLLAHPRNATD